MIPILSILTCTIPERVDRWVKLSQMVFNQQRDLHTNHPSLGMVEHLNDTTKAFLNGGLSIGKKREQLVEQATGKYLCFLDDDEDIAPNYIF